MSQYHIGRRATGIAAQSCIPAGLKTSRGCVSFFSVSLKQHSHSFKSYPNLVARYIATSNGRDSKPRNYDSTSTSDSNSSWAETNQKAHQRRHYRRGPMHRSSKHKRFGGSDKVSSALFKQEPSDDVVKLLNCHGLIAVRKPAGMTCSTLLDILKIKLCIFDRNIYDTLQRARRRELKESNRREASENQGVGGGSEMQSSAGDIDCLIQQKESGDGQHTTKTLTLYRELGLDIDGYIDKLRIYRSSTDDTVSAYLLYTQEVAGHDRLNGVDNGKMNYSDINNTSNLATRMSSLNERLNHIASMHSYKIGHGGTLDPLAEGVMAIGLGEGTKRLMDYLNGTKEYRATVIVGVETDSGDLAGQVIRAMDFETGEEVVIPEQDNRQRVVSKGGNYALFKQDRKGQVQSLEKGLTIGNTVEKGDISNASHVIDKVHQSDSAREATVEGVTESTRQYHDKSGERHQSEENEAVDGCIDKTATERIADSRVGEVVDGIRRLMPPSAFTPFSKSLLETMLPRFIGTTMQTPPTLSSLRVNNVRAYDLVAAGKPVQLEQRPVQITNISLDDYYYHLSTEISGSNNCNWHDINNLSNCGLASTSSLPSSLDIGGLIKENTVSSNISSSDSRAHDICRSSTESRERDVDGLIKTARVPDSNKFRWIQKGEGYLLERIVPFTRFSHGTHPVAILPSRSLSAPWFTFTATVGKGTYIRSLVKDICEQAGKNIGVLTSLDRIRQGIFSIESTGVLEIQDVNVNNIAKMMSRTPTLGRKDEDRRGGICVNKEADMVATEGEARGYKEMYPDRDSYQGERTRLASDKSTYKGSSASLRSPSPMLPKWDTLSEYEQQCVIAYEMERHKPEEEVKKLND